MNVLIDALLSNEIAQRVGWALVHFLWQGAAMAALLAVTLWLLPKKWPRARWAVSCVALFVMAVLPIVTACMVSTHTATVVPEVTEATEVSATSPLPMTDVPPLVPIHIDPTPTVITTPPAEDAAIPPPVAVGEPEPEPEPSLWQRLDAALPSALPWVVLGWVVGVIVMSVWHVGGWLHVWRTARRCGAPVSGEIREVFERLLLRLGIRRPIRLIESARVAVPTVIGWLRPVILLPVSAMTGLSSAQIEAVLAHELGHIRRYDCLVKMVQAVIETILFYHPAVWWVSNCIRHESEHCCDELALSVCGNRQSYAQALATLSERGRRGSGLVAAATGGKLLSRIRRIVGLPDRDSIGRSGWIGTVVLIALILSFAAIIAGQGCNGLRADADRMARNPVATPVDGAENTVEGPFELNTPINVSLNIDIPAVEKLKGFVWVKSVEFKKDKGELIGELLVGGGSHPRTEWQLRIDLLGENGAILKSSQKTHSAEWPIISGNPIIKRPQPVDFSFGPWGDVALAKKFRVSIKQVPLWGEAVVGVQVRLRADKSVWKASESPTFKADVRNRGERDLLIWQTQELCELEYDGMWYEWAGAVDAKSSAFAPARQYDGIPITLAGNWESKIKRGVGVGLDIKPGKHTVRVAFTAQPNDSGKLVRVVSNPVDITIEPALPGSTVNIEEALGDPNFAFAAVCETFEGPGGGFSERLGVVHYYQTFTLVQLLWGEHPVGNEFAVRYKRISNPLLRRERPIQKGETVIWLFARQESARVFRGIKALPDTPENRKAVVDVARRAAEPAEGLDVRLENYHDTWQQNANIVLHASIRNTSDRALRIWPDETECQLGFDGLWYTRDNTAGSVLIQPGESRDPIQIHLTRVAPWRSNETGKELELNPGKHSLRVAFFVAPDDDGSAAEKSISKSVSNLLDFELVPSAMDAYFDACEFLYEGGSREEAARKFAAVAKMSYAPDWAEWAAGLFPLLEAEAKEDAEFEEPKDLAALTQHELIQYYIFKLRDVAEKAMFGPGRVNVRFYPGTPNSAAVALRKIGKPAIPALIELLDDQRPTRSSERFRNGTHVLRYADAALQIIESISVRKFNDRPGRGAHLMNADPDTRAAIIAHVKAWWAANKDKTEAEWIREGLQIKTSGYTSYLHGAPERLIELEGARSVDYFRAWMKREPDNSSLIRLLWLAGGKDVIEDIRPLIASENRYVRHAAYKVLLQADETDYVADVKRELHEIVRDPEGDYSLWLVLLAEWGGPQEGIEEVGSLVKGEDTKVANKAIGAFTRTVQRTQNLDENRRQLMSSYVGPALEKPALAASAAYWFIQAYDLDIKLPPRKMKEERAAAVQEVLEWWRTQQHNSDESPWGEAVEESEEPPTALRTEEGVKFRMTMDKLIWDAGETPMFRADLTHRGKRALPRLGSYQVKLDGVWYTESLERSGAHDSQVFRPGHDYRNIRFTLDEKWRSKQTAEPMTLTAGQHRARLAFDTKGPNKATIDIMRLTTETVEFRVLGPGEKATEDEWFAMAVGGRPGSRYSAKQVAEMHRETYGEELPPADLARFYAKQAIDMSQTLNDPSVLTELTERALALEQDDLTRLHLYVISGGSYAGQVRKSSPSSHALRRRVAAEAYLLGLRHAVSLNLPLEPPPRIGYPDGYVLEHAPARVSTTLTGMTRQYPARSQLEAASETSTRQMEDLIERRQSLTSQIVQLYAREPDAFDELKNLMLNHIGSEEAASQMAVTAKAYRANPRMAMPVIVAAPSSQTPASEDAARMARFLKDYTVDGVTIEAGFVPDKTEIILGEPLFITFVTINRSDKVYTFSVGGDNRGSVRHNSYRLTAVNAEGQAVKDPYSYDNFGGFGGMVSLMPGQTYVERLYLGHWCAFERENRYTITCERTLRRPSRNAKSPPLPVSANFELRIAPAAPEPIGKVIAGLGEKVRSGHDRALYEATLALADIHDERVIPHLAFALTRRENRKKLRAIEGLSIFSSDEAADALLQALKDSDRTIRLRAGSALTQMNKMDRAMVPLLRELKDKQSAARRVLAARAVGATKAQAGLAPLLTAMEDPEPAVRQAAAMALGELGHKEAVSDLKQRLEDDDMAMRVAAVKGLIGLKEPFHNDWLSGVIRNVDPKESSFLDAVRLTRLCGKDDAAQALASCLDFDDPSVGNTRNMRLILALEACPGGPKYHSQFHHNPNTDGTPEQIENNRKILAAIKAWLKEQQERDISLSTGSTPKGNPALPGSKVSIEEALADPDFAFAAVCEAVEAPVSSISTITPFVNENQTFTLIQVLQGEQPRDDEFRVRYKWIIKPVQLERPIAKGERVIWFLAHATDKDMPGIAGQLPFRGIKALPDRPENRKAVRDAVAVFAVLKKGKSLSGIAHLPDGTPLEGAEAILLEGSYTAAVRDGRIEILRPNRSGRERACTTARTGPDGRFSLPTPKGPYAVWVIHDSGYAEVTAGELSASPEVTITPWERLDGQLLAGSKPIPDQSIMLQVSRFYDANGVRLDDWLSHEGMHISFEYQTRTDAEGRFVFEKVPPGKGQLNRLFDTADGGRSVLWGLRCVAKITSGQTNTVTLGGEGRPVIGRVVQPAGATLNIDWDKTNTRLILDPPPMHMSSAMSGDGPWAAYSAFLRSEEGKAYGQGSIKLRADGTFRVEGVPAGEYVFQVFAYDPDGSEEGGSRETVAGISRRVVVPLMPNGKSAEPLDIGAIELRPANRSAPDLAEKPEAHAWREAVKGVQVRLRADKTEWKAGETPTFKIDVKNNGPKTWGVAYTQELFQLEVDGKSYFWAAPVSLPAWKSLDQGKSLAHIPLRTGRPWHSLEGDVAPLPLQFVPGKHTVRVAFTAQPNDGGKPVRAVSNPVEITIVPAVDE